MLSVQCLDVHNEPICQERLHQSQTQHFHLSPKNHLGFFSNQTYKTFEFTIGYRVTALVMNDQYHQ